MKPLSTDQEPAGRTQCALSAVRYRLSALFALGLCLWLRADTKPTEPEPAAARRMVTIDGPKQRVYPLSLAAKHSFKALGLRQATEQLKAKAPDLDTTAEALQRYDAALQAIEAEVGE
ncbi:MAG: hypothetical protein ACI4RT_05375 [Candidatus Spyradenecus sp.]